MGIVVSLHFNSKVTKGFKILRCNCNFNEINERRSSVPSEAYLFENNNIGLVDFKLIGEIISS